MNSNIAFRLMRYASLALHTDCLPVCSQSLLVNISWTTNGNQDTSNANILHLLIKITLARIEISQRLLDVLP